MQLNKIINENCLTGLAKLPDNSVDCCVTSPPYFNLRDYGTTDQIGLEETPEQYVQKLVEVFEEVRRVLKKNGTLWLNLGDTYNSIAGGYDTNGSTGATAKISKQTAGARIKGKPRKGFKGLKVKDLIGIPWMVAFALRSAGWYLRQDIIWHKPNPMPESVRDRCTKSHEYIFLFSKSAKYHYDQEAIRMPLADESIIRLAQDIENQKGSQRVPGKPTAMKAVMSRKPRPGIDTHGNQGSDNGIPIARKKHGKETAASGSGVKGHNGYYNEAGDLMVRPTANKKSVWSITTKPSKEAHFAVFPKDVARPCIRAGCSRGGGST